MAASRSTTMLPSAHCARLRSVARTISLPVRMPAASALRSSTRYSAQRSSTALNQKATFVMCSSASPSTRSIESTSCCRGSLPKNCKPRSTSRTHKARREDRTLTLLQYPATKLLHANELRLARGDARQHPLLDVSRSDFLEAHSVKRSGLRLLEHYEPPAERLYCSKRLSRKNYWSLRRFSRLPVALLLRADSRALFPCARRSTDQALR